MPNPRIEQLQQKLKRSVLVTRIAIGVTLFFVALAVKELQADSWWLLLPGTLAFIAGSGAFGGFMEQRTYRQEINNYRMIDEQHVHGNPSPFVDVPPASPEPSDDNFWGQR